MIRSPLGVAALCASVFVLGCSNNDAGGGQAASQVGQFHDSAVQGLEYSGAGGHGLTDPGGRFSYRGDEPVSFAIGDIQLGQLVPAAYVTPLDLRAANGLSDAPDAVFNIARLLLTLDADCEPANGIQLLAAVRAAGQQRSLVFDQAAAAFASDPQLDAFLQASGAERCPQLVSMAAARAHLGATVDHIRVHGAANQAPSVAVQAPSAVISGWDVSLTGLGSDSDGQISFRWQQLDGPTVQLSDAQQASPTFIAPSVSMQTQVTLRLTVTDDDGAIDSADAQITILPEGSPTPTATPQTSASPSPAPTSSASPTPGVSPSPSATPSPTATPTATPSNSPTPAPNQPPLADAGAAQSVFSGDNVDLTGSGSDNEGSVSFFWAQLSGPAVTLNNADQAQASFVAPQVDQTTDLVFELTVRDSDNAEASDTTTVAVSPAQTDNLPPAADAGADQQTQSGADVVLDGSASSDPDGTISSVLWTQLDNGAPQVALNDADQLQASFTAPEVAVATDLLFELSVSDDDAASDADTVRVTVTPQQVSGAAPDYGSGLLGLLAATSADISPLLTALLDSNPESVAEHTATAVSNLVENLSDLSEGFDPTRPGETGVGLDGELDEAVLQLLGTARDAAPVVLTGSKLAGWSVPAAFGVAYPYPSGALYSGILLDPVGLGQVRDAHNGEMLYPLAGSLGAQGHVAVENLAAFRFDADSGEFVEIPLQVDERAPYFLANANSGFSTYSGTDPENTYVWDNGDDSHTHGVESWMMVDGTCTRQYPAGQGAKPDPVQGLDDDDEIVFMARDAGDLYGGVDFPDDWHAVQLINVLDPLAPQSVRAVYLVVRPGGSSFSAASGYINYQRAADADQWIDRNLFAGDDPEKLGTSNTSYGANLSGTVCVAELEQYHGDAAQCSFDAGENMYVCPSSDRFPRDGLSVTTDTYRFQASGRWMVRDLRVRAPDSEGAEQWAQRPDLIDRWKGRAFQQSPDSVISLVGFEDEQVNWEANSALIGERCGPVRCIREVWGADSGTNVTKTETFYRDAISYHYRVRVHPIPPDGLYTSWDYNREAMLPSAEEAAAGVAAGRYYTMLRPQGVPIDGRNDDLGNVDGYAPIPLLECVGNDGSIPPASNGRCPFFVDVTDPSFNVPLAFNNWEQVSGKGDAGSLIYSFELVGLTSLANPLVVPYYRDDACLDDGTGDDPVARPYPGESYEWSNGLVRQSYDQQAGYPLDYSGATLQDCEQRQGAYGSHGIHYFVTHDSDNAFTPLTSTEIDARQWQYIVPTQTPHNIGEPYANNVRVPLQAVAVPLSAPPLADLPLMGEPSQAACHVPTPSMLMHLLGSLHEHSGYSDGEIGTTPADYYAAGKAQGLDFMGGAEHSDNMLLPITLDTGCASAELLDCLQLSPDGLMKWQATQRMADEASDAQFSAFRGYEWTSDRFGHISVYFSEHNINAKTGTGYLASMEDFWLWLGLPASLGGGNDAVAVFNHPGREDAFHSLCDNFGPLDSACELVIDGDPAYAWNNLAFRPDAAAHMVGIEMFGKSGDYYEADHDAPDGGWFAHALDQGWHLGPVGAEDEHGVMWAQPHRAKTVLLAPDRSRAALKSAMQARRFYALAHGYNTVRIAFDALSSNNARWPMGSRVAADNLSFEVEVSGLATPRIQVIGPGGVVLHEHDGASFSFNVTPDSDEQWRYVRILDLGDADGDGQSPEVAAVSAPIRFRNGPAYPLCAADTQPPAEP